MLIFKLISRYFILSTAIPNTFKETNVYILRFIVTTDKIVLHILCILWCSGCFNECCDVQFRECAIVLDHKN